MKTSELKEALTDAGIEFDPSAKKAELQALYEASLVPVEPSEEPVEASEEATETPEEPQEAPEEAPEAVEDDSALEYLNGKLILGERVLRVNGIDWRELTLEDGTTELVALK